MIKKIKDAWNKRKKKKIPVIFLSVFSYEPIDSEHFMQIKDMLGKYGKKHNIEFALFSNTLVKPIERKELKELFDFVYKHKVEENHGKRRRNGVQVL